MTSFKSVNFQNAKSAVLNYYEALDKASPDAVPDVIKQATTPDYHWRGMHPYNDIKDAETVGVTFWNPFKTSFTSIQRRPDIFYAGLNSLDGFESTWVCQMGHLMGLFDYPWLGIRPTGRMTFMRFAEFHRVTPDGKIAETAFFFDIPMVMRQAGYNPFMKDTGAFFVQPGPLTHDGLLYDDAPSHMGENVLKAIKCMIDNVQLGRKDPSTHDGVGDAWHDDMIWFGPSGIGATYTKERYQHQHRRPLVENMNFDVPNHGHQIGHICRMAEGNYGGFFGWPNFYCIPTGNFMGLPATDKVTEFRVVDIYRVQGDKIAENWIFMDLLHFMKTQGVDVLENMQARMGGF